MIVLASASRARLALLRAAGIDLDVCPADLDEAAIKDLARRNGQSAEDTALALARVKAETVARERPKDLVIGADQMLDCDGAWFDKPINRVTAESQLRSLRGRGHRLVTAVAVQMGERSLWSHIAIARLEMRDFSDAFLQDYLDKVGTDVTASVGAYQLEGLGAQLFSVVEGDYFTILGLPLLPLLAFLRRHGVVAT